MTQPTTSGPIHGVTCPHCGKPNDFRPLQEQQLLDTGSTFECDHCKRLMTVTAIRPVTLVNVAKARAGVQASSRRQLPPVRQATTMSPAQTRRFLKGR